MSLITLDTDLTAVEVAKKEIQKLRNVVRDQLQARLEACKQEEDDEGNILFIEPPDMKWYIKEYRETLKVEGQMEVDQKREERKSVMDLMSVMQQQMKMSVDEKRDYRIIDVEVDEESDNKKSTSKSSD